MSIPNMQRYKLLIQYVGPRFHGWARSGHLRPDGTLHDLRFPSVQGTIERCLTKVVKEAHPIKCYGAGRTDAGVHALGQVAHVDISHLHRHTKEPLPPFPGNTLRKILNTQLFERGISVLEAEAVPATFHARFSAVQREYVYRLVFSSQALFSVFHQERAWVLPFQRIDVDLMRDAASRLVGVHDFTNFRLPSCSSPKVVRELNEIQIQEVPRDVWDDTESTILEVRFRARAFMRSQVRIMMSWLVAAGKGKVPPSRIDELFAQKEYPPLAFGLAPPQGLYLTRVEY